MNEKQSELLQLLRYFGGDEMPPEADKEILQRIERDDVLRAFADVLTSYNDFDESDSTSDRRCVSKPRLATLTPPPNGNSLDTVTSFEMDLCLGRSLPSVHVTATIEPIESNSSHRLCRLAAPWPTGFHPICLLVGSFETVHVRKPYVDERFSLAVCPESERPFPLASALYLDADRSAIESAARLRTAAAKSNVERRPARRFEDFRVVISGDRLQIESIREENQERDTVLVELSYVRQSGQIEKLVQVVTLKVDESGQQLVGETRLFDRPQDARGNLATLTVRPIAPADFALLNAEQASDVLARSRFEGIPIEETSDNCYSMEFTALNLEVFRILAKCAWVIRYEMDERGGL